MIIGICGFIGSGKDTVADYLVNFHDFRRESFASSLKDAVANVFGWDRVLLEGRTASSRAWRETTDEWWSNRLGMQITPRWVLQNWGTEVLRVGFHDDIWIASLENKIRTSKDNIVITDCRFENEIQAIKNAGGLVFRVKRGDEPEWYKDACDANAGDKCSRSIEAKQRMDALRVHPSEWSWLGADFDAVIENSTSIDELYNTIKGLVQDRLVSK